jgi:hypothetical protein
MCGARVWPQTEGKRRETLAHGGGKFKRRDAGERYFFFRPVERLDEERFEGFARDLGTGFGASFSIAASARSRSVWENFSRDLKMVSAISRSASSLFGGDFFSVVMEA